MDRKVRRFNHRVLFILIRDAVRFETGASM